MVRWSLFGVFIVCYPQLLKKGYGKQAHINQEKLQTYSQRRYAFIFCLLIELLIIDNGVSWLLNTIVNLISGVVL